MYEYEIASSLTLVRAFVDLGGIILSVSGYSVEILRQYKNLNNINMIPG